MRSDRLAKSPNTLPVAGPGPVEVGARQLGPHQASDAAEVEERVRVDRDPVGVRDQSGRSTLGWRCGIGNDALMYDPAYVR